MDDYLYDVAFSFAAEDEPLATKLNDLLKPRLKTFLYSERQNDLAGTDGEIKFNEVFGQQSRIVTVLYREKWGSTAWTRIEETAIRNRAIEQGYDFCIFIPLEAMPLVPPWLPKTRLWIGLKRWGIEAAAAVIEARVQDFGGSPREETVAERARRHEQDSVFQRDRETFMRSFQGIESFRKSGEDVKELIGREIDEINKTRSNNKLLAHRVHGATASALTLLGLERPMSVITRSETANDLQGANLRCDLWNGMPPAVAGLYSDQGNRIKGRTYTPDYSPDKHLIWKRDDRTFSNAELASEILMWWFDEGGVSTLIE